MHIRYWLEYQQIMDKIYLENLKYQCNFDHLNEDKMEQALDEWQLQSPCIHDFSIAIFSSFDPKHEDIAKIKALWLQIFEMNRSNQKGEIDLDYGDYEEMNDLLEQIEVLNQQAEKTTFSYFLKEHDCPYILDWINYKHLNKQLEVQETLLSKQHIKEVIRTDESEQAALAIHFIKNTTAAKLDLLNTFKAYTTELTDLLEYHKNVLKIKAIQQTHLIASPSLAHEYRQYIDETEKQIKELEVSFERHSLKLMCEALGITQL